MHWLSVYLVFLQLCYLCFIMFFHLYVTCCRPDNKVDFDYHYILVDMIPFSHLVGLHLGLQLVSLDDERVDRGSELLQATLLRRTLLLPRRLRLQQAQDACKCDRLRSHSGRLADTFIQNDLQ